MILKFLKLNRFAVTKKETEACQMKLESATIELLKMNSTLYALTTKLKGKIINNMDKFVWFVKKFDCFFRPYKQNGDGTDKHEVHCCRFEGKNRW